MALAAYHNLRTIPGYGATADRLLAGVLQRRSEQAGDYSTAMQADEALRRCIAAHSVRREADGRYGFKFDPR